MLIFGGVILGKRRYPHRFQKNHAGWFMRSHLRADFLFCLSSIAQLLMICHWCVARYNITLNIPLHTFAKGFSLIRSMIHFTRKLMQFGGGPNLKPFSRTPGPLIANRDRNIHHETLICRCSSQAFATISGIKMADAVLL